jgi:hypothetical protein
MGNKIKVESDAEYKYLVGKILIEVRKYARIEQTRRPPHKKKSSRAKSIIHKQPTSACDEVKLLEELLERDKLNSNQKAIVIEFLDGYFAAGEDRERLLNTFRKFRSRKEDERVQILMSKKSRTKLQRLQKKHNFDSIDRLVSEMVVPHHSKKSV